MIYSVKALNYVLHVPKIAGYLLSISKVTKSHVTFYPTHFNSKDLAAGKKISNAKEGEKRNQLEMEVLDEGVLVFGKFFSVSEWYSQRLD